MSSQTINLNSELYDYLLSVSVRENPVLTQLREEMKNHPVGKMQISPEQGQFMALLLKLMGAKRVLEIGVFTGYSSTVMALSLPEDGKLIGCDTSKADTDIARKYWRRAGVEDKIELFLAPALDTLNSLMEQGQGETFDFCFIDADKSNYLNYYEKCLWLVRRGGLIAIDNVLWYGKVADGSINDNRTNKIREFNHFLKEDSRIDLSLIPMGDGLTLARKK
ncbi:class I SAM-dependent methyltransferase [Cyanobacterium stanieri LEGE 03274]|uniref:Class I SAM-dependent methyltransferase n=1 Tax=Cyanobacterium stanieri LEGE 03274 TaxID=1828756 RepID=A0ABR9V4K7_9CHRO|nr:class I SAM-dependent methyltransferase [Cyanobacterium stanieri]MBE9222481.1 class I SAM-dependent methyltransferase [Cyanobacterium stanieri LEGE 03274]